MNTLIFDTETTGFPDSRLAFNDPRQGHIVQLACILKDEYWRTIGSFNSLIHPTHFNTIHPSAQDAHGISLDMCLNGGIDPEIALRMFNAFMFRASVVVAHNIKFDKKILDIDMMCTFKDGVNVNWDARENYCTMNEMTPICKLPSNGKFKWPKLQEAYIHCFGETFTGAHDALADVNATARVYKWLLDNGHVVRPTALAS